MALRVAVIATFFGRYENTFPLLHRLLVDSTRKPDEAWLLGETVEDWRNIHKALDDLYELDLIPRTPPGVSARYLPTPLLDGRYEFIPYSHKINWALNHTKANAIMYVDNGSMPSPYKIERMAGALEENPDWGAVYCAQKRTGMHEMIAPADVPVEDGYCALNYTQVMHRLTADRWPLDMNLADPDLADGTFWRSLHESLGTFYPASLEVLDEHHIPDAKAAGL